MKFSIGDRVRLTGPEWGDEAFNLAGRIVTIEGFSEDGAFFELDGGGTDGRLYILPEDGFGAELVRGWDGDPGGRYPVSEHGPIGWSRYDPKNSFEQNVRRILDDLGGLLVEKNAAYGDAALNPIRVFSKANRTEQLRVRLDDKLSRIQRGHEYPGDDTLRDIIGYCVLLLMVEEAE